MHDLRDDCEITDSDRYLVSCVHTHLHSDAIKFALKCFIVRFEVRGEFHDFKCRGQSVLVFDRLRVNAVAEGFFIPEHQTGDWTNPFESG